MASPLQEEREREILNQFVERFVANNLFVGDESKQYVFKMNNISKSSTLGNLAWAFYHACSSNEQEAVASFKNALYYDSNFRVSALTSMLSYLIQIGRVSEYEEAIYKELFFLKQHLKESVMPHVIHAQIFSGDFDGLVSYAERMNISDEASKMLQRALSIIKFIEGVGMDQKQTQKLMAIMTSIADKYRFSDLTIGTMSDKDNNANALIFYTSCKSFEAIADANLDLAYAIADHDDLLEMDFSPIFDYREDMESYLELV